ncbi:MAG TPA: type II secretion system F family protein [Ktedonobacterales bacterium]|nr:type II secretion system F family protein [Ktedonobacterales bacterium]
MLNPLLPILAMFLAFFGVLLVVFGVVGNSKPRPMEQRLREFAPRPRSLEELEFEQPISERFFRPLLQQLSRLVARNTPANVMENTQKRLLHGGNPNNLTVADFMGIKGLVAAVLAALGVVIGFFGNTGILFGVVLVIILGTIGFLLPDFWLGGKVRQRRHNLLRALPDAIDLLSISVEAGLGFDAALGRLVEKTQNDLAYEFGRVIAEMRIGVPRREALRALAERSGIQELGIFVTAIIQAEQLGASITSVLHVQSNEMRVRRRQRAEVLAHQAPIKMLFPMAFLIFPPMFVVILGPSIPTVAHIFLPNLFL